VEVAVGNFPVVVLGTAVVTVVVIFWPKKSGFILNFGINIRIVELTVYNDDPS
jgi:hypothetical protein